MAERKNDKPSTNDERYQVSDPSVLFEDVWAEDGEAPGRARSTRTCPTCAYEADLSEIRCPRCFSLLLTGCSGSCGACGSKTCAGPARKR